MGKRAEPEKTVRILRDAEAELAGGKTVARVVQKHGGQRADVLPVATAVRRDVG